jgi:hypothetical protein
MDASAPGYLADEAAVELHGTQAEAFEEQRRELDIGLSQEAERRDEIELEALKHPLVTIRVKDQEIALHDYIARLRVCAFPPLCLSTRFFFSFFFFLFSPFLTVLRRSAFVLPFAGAK